MSTENLSLDQAVEQMFVAEEPVQEVPEEGTIEESDTSDAQDVEEVTEDDSEVDYSDDEPEGEYEESDTDEESAEIDDEPDYEEPPKYTVKIDGVEQEVTLEDLKRSYSGQGKIQKGMQEAAEARKQAQAIYEQGQQLAQRILAMHQQVQEQGFVAKPQEPTRELFDADPIGYMEAKMQYDADIKAYNDQQGQMMQLRQYQQYQDMQAQQARLAEEQKILSEKIPEFSDPEKAGKFRDNLIKTASDFYGYSPEEVDSVTDHRALLMLADAMKWRQSQQKRSQVEKKAKKARPVIKPQAKKVQDPKRKQVQQSKSKLKKTGSINDALSLIFNE